MYKTLLATSAFALAALSFSSDAIAQQQPNLLIMGEDADQDSVARNSRIFNSVIRALEAEFQAEGFRVYDETAVSMSVTDPQRVRRTDAELITIARRIEDAPIGAIVVFHIYASTDQNPFADIMDLRVRIPGRLLTSHDSRITNVNKYVNLRRQPNFSAPVIRKVPLGEQVHALDPNIFNTGVGTQRARDACGRSCQAFGRNPDVAVTRDRAQQCIDDNMLWYEITDARGNRGRVSRTFLKEME